MYAARNRSRARSIHASMSRPGRSMRPPARSLGPATRAARHVVERAEQRGDVAQRRVRAAPVLDRPQRLALEVDDPVAVVRDEDLARGAGRRGCASRSASSPPPRSARRGPRSPAPRARSSRAASRSTAATAGRARLSCRCASCRHARSSSRVASRGARSGASGGGVASAAWRPATSVPEVRGDLGRPLEARGPGRRDEPGEELGGPLVRVRRRRRRTPGASRRSPTPLVAGHDLRPAREARHAGEAPPPRTGRRSARGPG